MNEITTFSTSVPASFSFKSDKLNEASAKIAVELAKMNTVAAGVIDAKEAFNRAVSPILAEVMEDKLYKADGFASVADYAEQTFGLKRSFAYMLARVGKRVKTLPELSEFTTSNAAELVNADGIAVKKAMESGELSTDSTQQELRDFAAAHPIKPQTGKVVPAFDLFAMDGREIANNVMKQDFTKAFGNFSGVVSAPIDGDARKLYIAYDPNGNVVMFESRPHAVKQAKNKGNFLDDLKAMLAKATPEQLDALKASFTERGKEA